MTVLVAYFPSPQGEAALDLSIEEARRRGTDLLVLNTSRGEALVEARRLYDDAAASLRARLDASGITYELRRDTGPGEPAERILDVADDIEPQVLVIGLRRRSRTGKLIFGSNAQRLLLEAPCPVLSVKADS